MKLLKVLVVMLVVMMLGTSALAADIDDLAHTIYQDIQFDHPIVALDSKWHYMTNVPCTEAEWEEACGIAIARAKFSGIWPDSYEDDPTTLRGQFFDPNVSYHGALILDLGDESVPMYALCALAAVALGGVVIAHKKRVCA
ncbi:MAG: hypothetical protein IJO98_10330 [Clostridia bacterium]|nr:hypothetical protein [Clostridia bacterium]